MSSNPFGYFVLFLKKGCSHLFISPLPPPPPETPTLQNPTVRSRWAHTCYTRHKYCCTPAVALVQVVLGHGSNACLHHSKKTYACTCVPRPSQTSHVESGDQSTPHPCTTAPSTPHSRGSASTVASAGSSSASPPWPTHPGREASPDRKKRCTHRLAVAEHQLLQLVVHFQRRRPITVCVLYSSAISPSHPRRPNAVC